MSRKLKSKIIAITEDSEDPVVRVAIGESKADIIVNTQEECLNVWYVYSEQKGDMKKMLDFIVERVGYDWVQFIQPFTEQDKQVANLVYGKAGLPDYVKFDEEDNKRDLEEALDGFQKVTEEHEEEEIEMLVGTWEVEE